ncbi:hypothetical protein F511_37816 [Dorcoceras hygrometricum]|uniref:Uncharacterized protein n=1 Tax=Dorcoceras hygrometricum TaxID=472368 RepID=A0A2Z7ANE3_9LAMI|nr:hypothetical protein F511_37816 [Dorcoceras hygrometricum]
MRLLRQPALEGLTRLARMDSPRRVGRNSFRRLKSAAAALGGGGGLFREEGRLLCSSTCVTLNGSGTSRGPTTIVAPKSQFRTCPTDHGKSV